MIINDDIYMFNTLNDSITPNLDSYLLLNSYHSRIFDTGANLHFLAIQGL